MISKAKAKAREKLKDEMAKDNNPFVQVVGDFLLQYLEQNPGAAEAILNSDKSIKKSLAEMKKVAEKNKVGNCAVITDQEGFAFVLNYFGIKEKSGYQPEASSPSSKPVPETDFDVKLEDLL